MTTTSEFPVVVYLLRLYVVLRGVVEDIRTYHHIENGSDVRTIACEH